jgi:hypothetical protein
VVFVIGEGKSGGAAGTSAWEKFHPRDTGGGESGGLRIQNPRIPLQSRDTVNHRGKEFRRIGKSVEATYRRRLPKTGLKDKSFQGDWLIYYSSEVWYSTTFCGLKPALRDSKTWPLELNLLGIAFSIILCYTYRSLKI